MKMFPGEFLQCSFGCFKSIKYNKMSSEISSKELQVRLAICRRGLELQAVVCQPCRAAVRATPVPCSAGSLGKLLGPLPMHPAAEDNYGYDACAVLCLPCVPNILVIATESGMLYHCVVLDGEEDDEQVPCLALSFFPGGSFVSLIQVPGCKVAGCLEVCAECQSCIFFGMR